MADKVTLGVKVKKRKDNKWYCCLSFSYNRKVCTVLHILLKSTAL